MIKIVRLSLLLAYLSGPWCIARCIAAEPPRTGPETEKRFPPLVVPGGFQATLYACDPFIEYPSAIAVGPKERPRSLFVAIDYMTGLGTEIVRRDEIRLIEDTDGDGYADQSTVVADGFNSIMGLTYHGNTLYVMHSPFLTSLTDTDGDGKADKRRDLLTGLGLPPEENDVRLHCANGLVMGHDGWLYLALGDHGCDVPRPEGDRLVYHGGGILRCRPDGRDLHLFASGLRNIYDVALDDELNVFVRDNENDGGDYKIRVCASFHGADHGYPYLYYERPDEALPPLADLGLGSSAGGAAYLQRQFPAEYHDNLFFCEWGRSIVRYAPRRQGAGFAPFPEMEFASGAANDPYGFKPTDLIVDRDGSLVVADWCDGQRPKRGRGRIYRISHRGAAVSSAENPAGETPAPRTLVAQLNSESHFQRVEAQDALAALGRDAMQPLQESLADPGRLNVHGRMHAVWILARDGKAESRDKLWHMAKSDPDPRVQVQAVRALADLYDPVFVTHRLAAGPADAAVAAQLAALSDGHDQRLLLEVVVALGRLKWPGAPDWLRNTLPADQKLDPFLAHAAMQTLRRCGNWPSVLKLLDLPADEPIRAVALLAVADQFEPAVVAGLIERLEVGHGDRRREYAAALARVCKQTGPWEYWGYRPQPRAAGTIRWEQTAAIEQALGRLLGDTDREVRLAVLRHMQREKIAVPLEKLAAWLTDERGEEAVAALLSALPDEPADQRAALLRLLIADRKQATDNRLRALRLLLPGNTAPTADLLRELIGSLEDGPVLAELLPPLESAAGREAIPLLAKKLSSPAAEVRAAAAVALTNVGSAPEGAQISRLLADKDPRVRRAAATAMGRLNVAAAVPPLLKLAVDADVLVCCAAFEALGQLRAASAAPLAAAALEIRDTQLAALACLVETGGPQHAEAIIKLAGSESSEAVVLLSARALAAWSAEVHVTADQRAKMDRAIQNLQGSSGLVVHWHLYGPLPTEALAQTRQRLLATKAGERFSDDPSLAHDVTATGNEGRIALPVGTAEKQAWLAWADVTVEQATAAQFVAAASGEFQVWINGRQAYHRQVPRDFAAYSDLFDGSLAAGHNRLVIQVVPAADKGEFQLRFRRKSSTAQHEQFVQAALAKTGNIDRGRSLFLDAAKTQCIKCHRIGSEGERVGPELTGLGSRFSRIHIVESILEPSRTVTPGFQTLLVRLSDGQTISGIKLAEDERSLTLADAKGEKHALDKAAIEAQQPQAKSTMPDGLVQQLTADQFVDLVAFLASQQQTRDAP